MCRDGSEVVHAIRKMHSGKSGKQRGRKQREYKREENALWSNINNYFSIFLVLISLSYYANEYIMSSAGAWTEIKGKIHLSNFDVKWAISYWYKWDVIKHSKR